MSVAAGYFASKTLAEKAAWEFVERENPAFDLVCLCPYVGRRPQNCDSLSLDDPRPMVYGPILNAQTASSLNESNKVFYDMLHGKLSEVPPDMGYHPWVDVRDLARAHIKAIETPTAGGHRIIVKADDIASSHQDIADALRKHFPSAPVPVGNPGGGFTLGQGAYYLVDNTKSKELFGMTYYKLEDTVLGTCNCRTFP